MFVSGGFVRIDENWFSDSQFVDFGPQRAQAVGNHGYLAGHAHVARHGDRQDHHRHHVRIGQEGWQVQDWTG